MANPVDGIIINATQLTVDEAAMTGESDEMKKDIMYFCKLRRDEKNAEGGKIAEGEKMSRAHEIPSPLLLSRTHRFTAERARNVSVLRARNVSVLRARNV